MEGGSVIRQLLVAVLVLSHLASSAMGGLLLVHCQGEDGHTGVEVSHPTACHDDRDSHSHNQNGAHAEPGDSHQISPADKHCKDDPILNFVLIRKHDAQVAAALPVTAVMYVIDQPRVVQPLPASPDFLRPPDAAGSLTGSVILLI